jgi:hypothetical protein
MADPFNQLLSGLRADLVARAGLALGSVLSAWPEPDLVQHLADSGPNPLVVITCGPSVPQKPGPDLQTSARTLIGPAVASVAPVYSEIQRLHTPLQVDCLGAGTRGKSVAGAAADAVATAWGPGQRSNGQPRSSVPLPDDGEVGSPYTLGVTAQLLYAGERTDDRGTSGPRLVYVHSVLWTVLHSRYQSSQQTLVADVALSLIIPDPQA